MWTARCQNLCWYDTAAFVMWVRHQVPEGQFQPEAERFAWVSIPSPLPGTGMRAFVPLWLGNNLSVTCTHATAAPLLLKFKSGCVPFLLQGGQCWLPNPLPIPCEWMFFSLADSKMISTRCFFDYSHLWGHSWYSISKPFIIHQN